MARQRSDRGRRCARWRMHGRWSNLGSQSGPMGATMGDAYFEWLSQAPPVAQVNHLISGGWIAQAVGVAAELGIADLLADGPKSSNELAQATGSHPRALYRLLRTLASIGVFTESAPRRFALTPMAELLRSDSPTSVRGRARFT